MSLCDGREFQGFDCRGNPICGPSQGPCSGVWVVWLKPHGPHVYKQRMCIEAHDPNLAGLIASGMLGLE